MKIKTIQNKITKMGPSGGDTITKISFSKKGVPSPGGTRPKGFAFGSGKDKKA